MNVNRVITLEYHDVSETENLDQSGFTVPGAESYKLATHQFQAHLDAVRSLGVEVVRVDQLAGKGAQVLMTFDDGGASAITHIAPMLEAEGWRGHFFVATGSIGTPGFLTSRQIVELHERGHVIGAHSVSHPLRMNLLCDAELGREWAQSAATLADILGEPVLTASIPGGDYSERIVRAASAAGIKYLFTSEPLSKISLIADTQVLGRYILRQSSSAGFAAKLAAGNAVTLSTQWLSWNLKKLAKTLAGPAYARVRALLLN